MTSSKETKTKKERIRMPEPKGVRRKDNPITVEEVIEALTESHGLLRIACDKLGCSRMGLWKFIQRHPEITEHVSAEKENLLDLAEKTLYDKAIKEKDTTALIFLLKCLGKHRGYVDKHVLQHEKSSIDKFFEHLNAKADERLNNAS